MASRKTNPMSQCRISIDCSVNSGAVSCDATKYRVLHWEQAEHS